MGSSVELQFEEKLHKLVNTQQSIQTLSQWVIFHRKRFKQNVDVWERQYFKATNERKLLLLYLANDVMQTSRKKGGEFIKEFGRAMPAAFAVIARSGDADLVGKLDRMLGVWLERTLFPGSYLNQLRRTLDLPEVPLPDGEIDPDSRSAASLGAGKPAPVIHSDEMATTSTADDPSSFVFGNPISATSAGLGSAKTAIAAPVVASAPEHPISEALRKLAERSDLDAKVVAQLAEMNVAKLIAEGGDISRAKLLLGEQCRNLHDEVVARQAAVNLLSDALEQQAARITSATKSLREAKEQLQNVEAAEAQRIAATIQNIVGLTAGGDFAGVGVKRPGEPLDEQPAAKVPRLDGAAPGAAPGWNPLPMHR